MNFAFVVLTVICLIEHSLLYSMSLSWEVSVVPALVIALYICTQHIWPTVASKMKTVFALLMLTVMLAFLPRDQQAALFVMYALFMHYMAWMIGYEGYLGKRPEVRAVNLPRNPRNAWVYTESFWPALLSAFFAIKGDSMRILASTGPLVGYTLIVLAFLFWEHGRRLSSSDQPVASRSWERPIYPLIARVVMLIALVLVISMPLAKVLPITVDRIRTGVESWIEQRRETMEEQLVRQTGNDAVGSGGEGVDGQGRSEQNIGFNEQPELPMRSKLGSTHSKDVYLHIHDPQARAYVETMQVYLRGSAMAIYHEDKWYPRSIVGTWYEDDEDSVNDGVTHLRPPSPAVIRHTVFLNKVRNRTLLSMPGMSSIMMDRLYEAAEDWFVFPDSQTLKVSYTADSFYLTLEQALRLRPEIGGAEAEYYSVPEDPIMPDMVGLANSIIDPDAPMLDKVVAYRNYLRDNYRYTREVTNPNNLPPLQNFLFDEQAGYCDFYATSLTLMLRSQGIPSRLSVGYTGGTYDNVQDLYTFYSDNAHSWTEVYFENLGWVIVDATPPDISTPEVVSAAPENAPDLSQFENISEEAEAQGVEDAIFVAPSVGERLKAVQRRVIPYLAGLLLCALLVIIFMWSRRKVVTASLEADGVASPRLCFYLEIKKYLRASGVPDRASHTPGEYRRALLQRGWTDPAFDELTEYVYAVNYRGVQREPSREKHFVRCIKALVDQEKSPEQ